MIKDVRDDTRCTSSTNPIEAPRDFWESFGCPLEPLHAPNVFWHFQDKSSGQYSHPSDQLLDSAGCLLCLRWKQHVSDSLNDWYCLPAFSISPPRLVSLFQKAREENVVPWLIGTMNGDPKIPLKHRVDQVDHFDPLERGPKFLQHMTHTTLQHSTAHHQFLPGLDMLHWGLDRFGRGHHQLSFCNFAESPGWRHAAHVRCWTATWEIL